MIAYTHKTHPRSKSIKLHINQNGEVIVTSPKFTPQFLIKKMVQKHETWIKKQLATIHAKQIHTQTDDTIMVFGKKYTKNIICEHTQPLGTKTQDGQLIINVIDKAPDRIKREVERFLKSTAKRYLFNRTKQIAEKMSITFNKISIKQQKTRWGSCSSQGNLNFNWSLIHFLPVIIDYVIIHELAHRVHMDHSSAFWGLVKKYDPSYQEHRGWLKRNGLSLG